MDTTQALIAIICGMSVMIVLIIALLVTMLKYIRVTKDSSASSKVQEQIYTEVADLQQQDTQTGQDDGELVAVITAALATMLGTTTDRLVVTSFRQVNSKTRWYAR